MVHKKMTGRPRTNLTSANKHVPDIELQIRVVKERTRAARHRLPFNMIPKLLTIYIVFTVIRMLNIYQSREESLPS